MYVDDIRCNIRLSECESLDPIAAVALSMSCKGLFAPEPARTARYFSLDFLSRYIHTYIYVCVCVWMDGWMYVCDGWMNVSMYGWMDVCVCMCVCMVCMDVCMYVYVCICMSVCMYVSVYVCTSTGL